jgi:uncharacterized protein (DUF4415 family)
MKKKHTENIVKHQAHTLPADKKTNWKKVDALRNDVLVHNAKSDEDAILADENFWLDAHLVMPATSGKERITIRLDSDVLEWLREQGRGYQARINTILRTCMTAMKTHYNPKAR